MASSSSVVHGVRVIPPLLFVITDPAYAPAHIESVVLHLGESLPLGSFGVQLRDKRRARDERHALGARLRRVTSACRAPLIINGDLALAGKIRADGVHLGADAPPLSEVRGALQSMWISVAAHSDADVERALAGRADAVMVSPIYETPGKGPPRGVRAIERARSIVGGALAVYALGGVCAGRARACRDAGATGVAIVRAVLDGPDPVIEAQRVLAEL